MFCPSYPAIDAGEEVVDIDTHIGIEFGLEKNPDIEDGHQYADGPQPFVGLVFQV